jgi:hypothetical protein
MKGTGCRSRGLRGRDLTNPVPGLKPSQNPSETEQWLLLKELKHGKAASGAAMGNAGQSISGTD